MSFDDPLGHTIGHFRERGVGMEVLSQPEKRDHGMTLVACSKNDAEASCSFGSQVHDHENNWGIMLHTRHSQSGNELAPELLG